MILILDNYDSFVHNVARHFSLLGAHTEVVRSDAVSLQAIERMRPAAIVLSPGPCTPAEAGISCAVVADLSGRLPILGICLGHQCIGAVFGGTVRRAERPMHGQACAIDHGGRDLFDGLPNPLRVGRYHSLIVERSPQLETHLRVDAVSPDGEIMAFRHRTHPTFGVQFHPESILTEHGLDLLGNFLAFAREPARHALA